MDSRPLGRTGVRVSALGLGCSSLGGGVFNRDDAQALRVLRRARERGVTFYDTADSYGYGHSERLIGRAFAGRRRDVVIASKAGFLPSSLARWGRMALPAAGLLRPLLQPWKRSLKRVSKPRQDFSATHILRALEGSLRRLRTDYVDVYLLHNPPPAVLERGEAFEVLERCQRAGSIRHYGVSAATAADALIALQHPGIAVLEVAFNWAEPDAAAQVIPSAARQGVGIIARVPLGRGLLTDRARVRTGISHEATPEMRRRRAALEEQAGAAGLPISHAALRFVLQHPEVSTAIPGTRSVEHLEENLGALNALPLSRAERSRVTEAASCGSPE